MHFAVPLAAAICLSACERQDQPSEEPPGQAAAPAPPQPSTLVFAGAGRDRLCLNPETKRAGFITYGQAGANCSMRGSLGEGGVFQPDGDAACPVRFTLNGDEAFLGDGPSGACAYYCGPGATYSGRRFTRMAQPDGATDLAGDPLC
ncbi:hypothetical protein ACFQPG_08435 [Sphingomonas sp. GCM10030256]|uniref:hypothetical protein n=1 Tax=Sphingomonas sp. GCM10030256 TaxID=3273427 RepID=UPI00361974DC